MPLALHGIETSPPSTSVNLVIHALDLQAEYKTINPTVGEHLTPEFSKLNPINTIPVIDDDGFLLWESRAIMTYLVSKYAKDDALYPKDLQKRAVVDQRLHFSNDLFRICVAIAKPLIYFNAGSVSEENLQKVKEAQDNFEKLLKGHTYIAGDDLTVADFSCITLVDVLEFFNPAGDQRPLTKAWFDLCQTTMKDFDTVFKPGSDILKSMLNEKMKKQSNEQPVTV